MSKTEGCIYYDAKFSGIEFNVYGYTTEKGGFHRLPWGMEGIVA